MPRKKKTETEDKEILEGRVEGTSLSYTEEEQRIRAEVRDRIIAERDDDVYGTNKLSQITGQIMRNRARSRGTAVMSFSSGAELAGAIDAYWCLIFKDQERGVDVMPDVEHLADFLGITRDTLLRWARGEENLEFIDPIAIALSEIALAKKQRAFNDRVNALAYMQDLQNNHGYLSTNKAGEMTLNVRVKHEMPTIEQLNEQMKLIP